MYFDSSREQNINGYSILGWKSIPSPYIYVFELISFSSYTIQFCPNLFETSIEVLCLYVKVEFLLLHNLDISNQVMHSSNVI